ncbi:hypothetical protein ASO20_01845 [Mycoplasma sp. (ex Biomphalaria glabrata)]|uniref:50S ribosomal protein L23 n=1 Tax=Mycoplasma sp. (ex Biomphalaria glabrata) TaxID=1749074 RepID=UPI00073AAC60|nr:50S ribosomal protein L23 [Mycoplasma sp. (ex Biomphalaria glabrata)]ALV23390.1 hypothetical protein ASO20_01845 [Mycoplasma sp. (ex Biomphalaria glabrata)]
MDLINVIKKPVLTEKSYRGIQDQKYTFEVDRKSTKLEIKKAFEQLFGAKVASVNVINKEGKKKTVGRFTGRKNHAKYAIITLKPGEKLEIFDEANAVEDNAQSELKGDE